MQALSRQSSLEMIHKIHSSAGRHKTSRNPILKRYARFEKSQICTKREECAANRTRPFPPGVTVKWTGVNRAMLQTKTIVSLSAGAVKASGCASRNRRQINAKRTRISRRSFPAYAGYAPAGFAPFQSNRDFFKFGLRQIYEFRPPVAPRLKILGNCHIFVSPQRRRPKSNSEKASPVMLFAR